MQIFAAGKSNGRFYMFYWAHIGNIACYWMGILTCGMGCNSTHRDEKRVHKVY